MTKDGIVMGIATLAAGFFLIMAFTGKARFDEARLSELRRELHEQQTDNEDLRYQLKQCKILYQGL